MSCPKKSGCPSSSTCACSATRPGTGATASTEDRKGGYVQGPGPDPDGDKIQLVSKDPFTQDILTATAFINQILRKTGLGPHDIRSITLTAGFSAVVSVYVRDADGGVVFDQETKEYETTEVETTVLWDTKGLKGSRRNGTGDDSDQG
ncbi:hypothetical protein SEA_SHAGRAT_68 [Rhodococcus phage Shagrat]|nr:hypothetical protein SEA_SHAGRAT_68 [Rhodococcus phage Shagrat]